MESYAGSQIHDIGCHPAGELAVSHDIYFGNGFNDVNAANRTNPMGVYIGNQPKSLPRNNLQLNLILTAGTTYYWRVDDVDSSNTIHRGNVWRFAVNFSDTAAVMPMPADGLRNVSLDIPVFNWSNGKAVSQADSYRFYLGTNPFDMTLQSTVQKTILKNSELVLTLDYNKTYYWRVDTLSGGNTYEGYIWNFTTQCPAADVNKDCKVNLLDFAEMARDWLR